MGEKKQSCGSVNYPQKNVGGKKLGLRLSCEYFSKELKFDFMKTSKKIREITVAKIMTQILCVRWDKDTGMELVTHDSIT